MQKSILFVDEEEFVRKALQRSFRKLRTEWDMRFVTNPREAAKALASIPALLDPGPLEPSRVLHRGGGFSDN